MFFNSGVKINDSIRVYSNVKVQMYFTICNLNCLHNESVILILVKLNN